MTIQGFRYRLLGPLAVEYQGENVCLGGFRQQTLLTMLLLDANRVMHLERLIDAIWDSAPPASAKNQVRICVSGLRRQFAAKGRGNVIETHPIGYRIRVPADALDFYRFEELAVRGRAAEAEGRPEEAVALLRSALELWTGPIAAGLDSALVQSTAVKLHEDRISVLEDRFDLELQLGRQRRVIGELTSHVSEHPFRETLCAQLMLALYQSGRQADALEFFRITRKRFSDELGIEPGENLRTLEYRILTNDPVLSEHRVPESLATIRQAVEVRPPARIVVSPQSNGRDLRNRLQEARVGISSGERAARELRRTEDRLERLERENAQLRTEHDVFKRVVASWLQAWERDGGPTVPVIIRRSTISDVSQWS